MSSVKIPNHIPQNMYFPDQQTPVTFKTKKPMQTTSSRARSDFGTSRSSQSHYTASINHRVEQACTTNSNSDLRKQVMLLRKQLQKMEKQILRKDQIVLEMKAKWMPNKQGHAQTEELYRALSYYQGKVKQMEVQIQKFRSMILRSPDEGVTAENLSVLFEDFRKDNEQISAKYQESEYMHSVLKSQHSRLKSKYLQCQRELSQVKRVSASPLNNLLRSDNKIPFKIQQYFGVGITSLQAKEKEVLHNQLVERVQGLERQNLKLRGELDSALNSIGNLQLQKDLLMKQIQEKDQQVTDMFKQLMGAKRSLRKIESQKDMDFGDKGITPHFKGLGRYNSLKNI